jgi:hypothetical protein
MLRTTLVGVTIWFLWTDFILHCVNPMGFFALCLLPTRLCQMMIMVNRKRNQDNRSRVINMLPRNRSYHQYQVCPLSCSFECWMSFVFCCSCTSSWWWNSWNYSPLLWIEDSHVKQSRLIFFWECSRSQVSVERCTWWSVLSHNNGISNQTCITSHFWIQTSHHH